MIKTGSSLISQMLFRGIDKLIDHACSPKVKLEAMKAGSISGESVLRQLLLSEIGKWNFEAYN